MMHCIVVDRGHLTHRPVRPLLASMLAPTRVHLDVHIVDDVEEILDDGHSFVAGLYADDVSLPT